MWGRRGVFTHRCGRAWAEPARTRATHHARTGALGNPADTPALGFADGDLVDLVSEWTDGIERRVEGFRL
uniref:hypothetical protein n=1 Tax=Nocardia wallacei TaxID=480035 RepID=UPI0024548DF0